MDKERVIFKRGEQKQFIELICDKNIKEFCRTNKNIKIPYSTFKKYRSETRNLPLSLYRKLKKIKPIKKIFNIKIVNLNFFASKGGRKGIKALIKRYGKERVKRWRKENVIESNIRRTYKINYPKINEKIAEFVGAYLGDGTLTKQFLRIFGDKRYDLFYLNYLTNLIEDLFGLKPSIRIKQNGNLAFLEISSKLLCNYLKEKFKIQPGSKIKNKTIIPNQIIKDKNLFMHCLRGLIDTDGSVSKDNTTISVSFYSRNLPLLNQVYKLNIKYNLFTFTKEYEIGTKSKEKVINYFNLVGSSNLKHIIRFEEFLKGNILKRKYIRQYYGKYKNINLPHFGPMV